jgi:hypothetical protein
MVFVNAAMLIIIVFFPQRIGKGGDSLSKADFMLPDVRQMV